MNRYHYLSLILATSALAPQLLANGYTQRFSLGSTTGSEAQPEPSLTPSYSAKTSKDTSGLTLEQPLTRSGLTPQKDIQYTAVKTESPKLEVEQGCPVATTKSQTFSITPQPAAKTAPHPTTAVSHEAPDSTELKESFSDFMKAANNLFDQAFNEAVTASEDVSNKLKKFSSKMHKEVDSLTKTTGSLIKKGGQKAANKSSQWLNQLAQKSQSFLSDFSGVGGITYTVDDSDKQYYYIRAELPSFDEKSITISTAKEMSGRKSVTIKATQETKREETRTTDDGTVIKEYFHQTSHKMQTIDDLPSYVSIDEFSSFFDKKNKNLLVIKFKKINHKQS